MQLAKKTVFTNTAKEALGVQSQNIEDAIVELHKNDNDNFAIGDVKLSARDISDPNWLKCDGAPLTSIPEETIGKNLINNNNFSTQAISVSGYTISDNGVHAYIDDNYMIIPARQVSGGNVSVVLLIYVRTNGLFTFSGAKVLWTHATGSSSSYSGVVKAILKAGSYYYAIWKWWVAYDTSQTVNWNASYVTNPTETWTNVEVVSKSTTQSANYLYLLSADTDGSNIKMSICGNTSMNITIYTGSGTLSNLTETTQTRTSTSFTVSDSSKATSTGVAPGSMSVSGGVGSITSVLYKASFTSNWQVLSRPSWARDFYYVFYIGSKWWGLYNDNTTGLFVVIADSLSDLSTGTLSNLIRIDIGLSGSVSGYTTSTTLVNDGLSMYMRVVEDSTNNIYMCRVTKDGASYKLIDANSYGNGTFSNNPLTTGITMTSSGTSFIVNAISIPEINLGGIAGYMKIADN